MTTFALINAQTGILCHICDAENAEAAITSADRSEHDQTSWDVYALPADRGPYDDGRMTAARTRAIGRIVRVAA